MKEYGTPAIAFTEMTPRSLYKSIDDVITSRGGNEVLSISQDFHAYDIAQKGAVLVSIRDPPVKGTFTNTDGRIDKPISGIVQLLGFQVDEFYKELYSSLSKLQK